MASHMALRDGSRSPVARRRLKTALSSVTGAGAVFLSVMAQDTHGSTLLWLASGAGALGGISAVSGYFSVHRARTVHHTAGGTDQDPAYIPPPNLPATSRYFTGREDELRVISGALQPNPRHNGVQFCVVHGLGGVGKSQLAAVYARVRRGSSHSLTWWLSASSHERLRGELLELAACLGIPEHESKSVMLNRLWGRLRDSPGWLLIYDDAHADSLGLLNGAASDSRPSLLPRGGQGEVLITTQQQEGWEDLSADLVEFIELSGLGPTDGLAFLRARIDAEDDEKDLSELGAELHWLPLALDQAGAYIAQAEISVEEYLRRLPDHAPGSAAATFRLAIERVTEVEPVAEDLMRLCSFLASEDVPRDMLLLRRPVVVPSPLREVMENRVAFNHVVRRLSDHSLLIRSGDSRLGTVVYGMHPQVQLFVRQRMDAHGRLLWSQSAVQLVEAAFPTSPEKLDQRAGCERLMPHVQAVMAEVAWAADLGDDEYGAARDPEALVRLLHRAGLYQERRGISPGHVLDYFEKEALLRGLGIGDALGLIDARLAVARQCYRLANLDLAERKCREILDQWPVPSDIPASRTLRAQCLRQLGDILRERIRFDEALQIIGQAISIYEARGPEGDGLDWAIAEEEAGMIHRNAGQLTEALDHYERAAARIPRSGSQEPLEHTVFRAMLWRDAGIVAQDRGDLSTAEHKLRLALSVFGDCRGSDDFETAQIAKFLADVLRRQGEELRQRARETHHPLRRQRLRRKARGLLRDAAGLLGPVVEQHHKRRETEEHKYAACLNKLGSLQLAQGRTQQALATLRVAEHIYATAYGARHPYRAKTLSRLGAVHLAMGDRAGAERVLREAEAIFLTSLGDHHPSLIAVYERLAACTADPRQAVDFRARAQHVKQVIGGAPQLAQSAWRAPVSRPAQ